MSNILHLGSIGFSRAVYQMYAYLHQWLEFGMWPIHLGARRSDDISLVLGYQAKSKICCGLEFIADLVGGFKFRIHQIITTVYVLSSITVQSKHIRLENDNVDIERTNQIKWIESKVCSNLFVYVAWVQLVISHF